MAVVEKVFSEFDFDVEGWLDGRDGPWEVSIFNKFRGKRVGAVEGKGGVYDVGDAGGAVVGEGDGKFVGLGRLVSFISLEEREWIRWSLGFKGGDVYLKAVLRNVVENMF